MTRKVISKCNEVHREGRASPKSPLDSRYTWIPQLPEARWNPGAAKASDCEVSKSFCALARRCYEARHPLEAPLMMSAQREKPVDFAAEGLHLASLSIATAESGLKACGND